MKSHHNFSAQLDPINCGDMGCLCYTLLMTANKPETAAGFSTTQRDHLSLRLPLFMLTKFSGLEQRVHC